MAAGPSNCLQLQARLCCAWCHAYTVLLPARAGQVGIPGSALSCGVGVRGLATLAHGSMTRTGPGRSPVRTAQRLEHHHAGSTPACRHNPGAAPAARPARGRAPASARPLHRSRGPAARCRPHGRHEALLRPPARIPHSSSSAGEGPAPPPQGGARHGAATWALPACLCAGTPAPAALRPQASAGRAGGARGAPHGRRAGSCPSSVCLCAAGEQGRRWITRSLSQQRVFRPSRAARFAPRPPAVPDGPGSCMRRPHLCFSACWLNVVA